ncbi:MAG: modification methylase protein [Parcubacteria group bacterium GW2011_GWC1_35_21]|uniref:Modification methylase protein n=1 Tax=Candidatus Nomurabacteria bacterium GW2011_GWA1_36_15 TaxID=1618728 RepID=A0A0G0H218_9BACT|nr:MAG: modification methylase protein [Parcubacteria group bacterium GW2011_GWC1_35_21]KKP97997.1 MAG: modification methylase protein [Candidatus Nomurabacteria bacterium GW2011_GWA1_36_15]
MITITVFYFANKFMSKKLYWKTEKRRVNDLLPYEKNPRQITETQMEDLKRSFQKFNIVELPAINLDGKIVAGHMRIKALQLLGRGEEEIEVRLPNRKLTEAEFKQYMLTSNRSGGSWDWNLLEANFDIDLLLESGFDSGDLTNIFDDNLEITDDNFDETKELEKIKVTDIKPGDMFSLGRHRLICGNALYPFIVKKLMGNKKIDTIDIDPPFNISLDYDKGVGGKAKYGGKTNDKKTDDEYRIFLKTLMENALSVSKENAHVFFWCDERYTWLIQELYRELGLDSKRVCIWVKDNASPTPNVAFNKVTEFCVYGTIGKPYLSPKVTNVNEIMNKEMTTGNRLTEDILDQLNIWLVKRLPGSEYEHPTQKPPTLHEKALRRCTRPGDIVLDLTAGSGSILSACEQLKRTAYLCDCEPIFCQLIINRFKQISNEKITKLN